MFLLHWLSIGASFGATDFIMFRCLLFNVCQILGYVQLCLIYVLGDPMPSVRIITYFMFCGVI